MTTPTKATILFGLALLAIAAPLSAASFSDALFSINPNGAPSPVFTLNDDGTDTCALSSCVNVTQVQSPEGQWYLQDPGFHFATPFIIILSESDGSTSDWVSFDPQSPWPQGLLVCSDIETRVNGSCTDLTSGFATDIGSLGGPIITIPEPPNGISSQLPEFVRLNGNPVVFASDGETPEPATTYMFISGLLGVAIAARKLRKARE